jgi:hypothetical protein
LFLLEGEQFNQVCAVYRTERPEVPAALRWVLLVLVPAQPAENKPA